MSITVDDNLVRRLPGAGQLPDGALCFCGLTEEFFIDGSHAKAHEVSQRMPQTPVMDFQAVSMLVDARHKAKTAEAKLDLIRKALEIL